MSEKRPQLTSRTYFRYWQHEVWDDDKTPLVPEYCDIVNGCDPTVAVGDFEFCTGLCDQNQTPLFENDIVKFTAEDGTEYVYKIVWLQRELCFGLLDIDAAKLMYYEIDDFKEMILIGTEKGIKK